MAGDHNLYCTADSVGTSTGGGVVTRHESEALKSISGTYTQFDRRMLGPLTDPFAIDLVAKRFVEQMPLNKVKLAHFYSGAFPETVRKLREYGVRVSYTAAAHDPKISREEFESLGIPYNFPHITEPKLWGKYIDCYQQADLVICPSELSAELMRGFGCGRVCVIPHGVEQPTEVKPIPKDFVVGYLGQSGPDKGLQYLFRAWKMASLPDARLILAGRGIESTLPLLRAVGGGNVEYRGFVDSISDFYNSCTVYVQPSATEGFGIEVLEAMAHGRPVVCSDGAGAVDVVDDRVTGIVVPRRNPEAIANALMWFHDREMAVIYGSRAKKRAEDFTWDKIEKAYTDHWKNHVALQAK